MWAWSGERGRGTDLVFEADVGEYADPREHELGHGGDASEGVLHHQGHDAAGREEMSPHSITPSVPNVPVSVREVQSGSKADGHCSTQRSPKYDDLMAINVSSP